MSRRRRSSVTDGYGENALTWFVAGLLVIGLMAGLLGQVTPG
jgi:hypothetical protein